VIKITDLKCNLLLIAHGEQLILTDCQPVKQFVDGKPTDTIVGYRYTIVAPQNKYESFTVRIDQATPAITPDELEAKGGTVKCKLKGFEGKFFKNKQNEYQFTAKADSLEVLP